jgi:16S rRNA (cytosine967-C5)-methyltransferase
MTNPRIKSAQILQTIIEDKIFFGELKKQISEKDLPFINMLILTTLRRFRALDIILQSFLSKKIPHKHQIAKYLLIAAEAEILFMNTAPYAILNETVGNIRKTTDKFLAGAANAILRKIVADKDNLRRKAESILPLPDNFLPILRGYSPEEIQNIANCVNVIPELDITAKSNPQEWSSTLDGTLLPNGSIRVFNNLPIHALPDYNKGDWWVQDAAAALPVQVMGNLKGLNVIDLCAAPGGKTAQLAARGALVTALDISDTRLNTLKQNMTRLKLAENVKTITADAAEFMQQTNQLFDCILLDAPCSATGTFRRHPEVLYIKNKEDVQKQVILQQQLLNLCKKILRPDGILVYSVCSICKAEGEEQIADFLRQNPEFKVVKITEAEISSYGKWQDNLITPEGYIRTLPYFASAQKGMDSFFICKMQRII